MSDDKDKNSTTPTATDFPLTAGEPQQGQVTAAADILAAPVGDEKIGTLAAGDPVIVNGTSSDGWITFQSRAAILWGSYVEPVGATFTLARFQSRRRFSGGSA